MKLCLRPIESDLPVAADPLSPSELPTEVPPEGRDLWLDSSLDLARGLDVIELPVDVPPNQERLTVYPSLKRQSPVKRGD